MGRQVTEEITVRLPRKQVAFLREQAELLLTRPGFDDVEEVDLSHVIGALIEFWKATEEPEIVQRKRRMKK